MMGQNAHSASLQLIQHREEWQGYTKWVHPEEAEPDEKLGKKNNKGKLTCVEITSGINIGEEMTIWLAESSN